MVRIRFYAVCFAMLMLGSMFPVSSRGEAPLLSSPYYPLQIGREWVFSRGPVELVERVTAHEMIGDELCARLETVYNGQVLAFEHLAVREDGIYRVAVAGQRVEPPLCFLKLPCEPGTRWSVDSKIVGQQLAGSFVALRSQVTVPAGEFDTIRTRGEGFTIPTPEGGSLALSFSYDFAAGVGKVRQVVQVGEMSTEMVLKEISVP